MDPGEPGDRRHVVNLAAFTVQPVYKISPLAT